MTRRLLRGGVAAAITALACLLPTTAVAQDAQHVKQVTSALKTAAKGKLSPEHQALLEREGLLGQVPDPVQIEWGVIEMPQTAKTGTWWVDVWFRQKSYLGSTIYKWHHKVEYRTEGSNVTQWISRYDYLSEAQSIIYVRDLKANHGSALPSQEPVSHMQRHLEYCVIKYGCYASTHPWSKIWVRDGAKYRHEGSTS